MFIASEFYTEAVKFCLLPPNFIRRRLSFVYRLRILYGGGGMLSIASEFYTEAVEDCRLVLYAFLYLFGVINLCQKKAA